MLVLSLLSKYKNFMYRSFYNQCIFLICANKHVLIVHVYIASVISTGDTTVCFN